MASDAIAAIATAWGEAGIAIVRLSGTDALRLAETVLRFKAGRGFPPPRLMRLASLVDENGDAFDEVLCVRFAAPNSYTGEDAVEIHTHGGTLAAQLCLEHLVRNGARLAEPGEFTKRAFLNGRIDLSQSESVLGIIRSRSAEALRAAARTLSGELSALAGGIREELLTLQGALEVELDFPEDPEDDAPCGSGEEPLASISAIRRNIEDLLGRCSAGFLLREGVRVALTGRPNVGKSSLLNALLKRERAIVTAVPGTTRDVIEETITCRGVPIRLADTAGLRAPCDEAEASGIERALAELRRADVCVWVLDGSAPLSGEDREYLERARSMRDGDCIIALNKSDLPAAVTEAEVRAAAGERCPVLPLSAKTGDGLERLKEHALSMAAGLGALDAGLNVTARQLSEIRGALAAVTEAADAVTGKAGDDVTASLLSEARACVERLLGLDCDDALLDSVFSRFCVGK